MPQPHSTLHIKNDIYLELEIEMNEDPPASCGDPDSEKRKVCEHDYVSFFLPSDINLLFLSFN